MARIGKGTVVRHLKWRGSPTGTVVSRRGGSLFVAWHGSFVESEIDVAAIGRDLEVWADAPEELRRWCGGIGVFEGGRLVVQPVVAASGD